MSIFFSFTNQNSELIKLFSNIEHKLKKNWVQIEQVLHQFDYPYDF